MKILRTASLGFNFTGSYKKRVQFQANACVHFFAGNNNTNVMVRKFQKICWPIHSNKLERVPQPCSNENYRKLRSSRQSNSIEIGVLKNFTKFAGKHLCQSLCNFIKKATLAQVFSCEFCEIFQNNFFTEHFRTTASLNYRLLYSLSFSSSQCKESSPTVDCHLSF